MERQPSLARRATLTKRASVASHASVSRQSTVRTQASITKQSSLASTVSLTKRSSKTVSQSLQQTQSTASLKRQATSGSQRTAKRKVDDDNETRTKRQRIELKPFQLPDAEPKRRGKKKQPAKQKPVLVYKRAQWLALRNDKDRFYLCQLLQNIWEDTTRFRILWLSEVASAADQYNVEYVDESGPDCIISHVTLIRVKKNTYRLPETERKNVEKKLKRVLDKEKGIAVDSDDDSDDEADQKKTKKAAKKKKTPLKKQGSKAKPKDGGKSKKTGGRVKKTKAKPVKKREVWTEEERKNPNLRLKPNPKIKVWKKNPFLETTEEFPFISTMVQSKLISRAATLNDVKLLQKYVADVKHICRVDLPYSVGLFKFPMEVAMDKQNKQILLILMKEIFNRDPKSKRRCDFTKSLLSSVPTGRYNYRSLGIPVIRALTMSRGSREGNNAFTKDLRDKYTDGKDVTSYVRDALRKGVKKSIIDAMFIAGDVLDDKNTLYENIYIAVRNGHNKLAGQLMEEQNKIGQTFFNALHRNVLLYDNEDLTLIRAASVKKKPWDNFQITPVHCAAINPNIKYISALLNCLPEYGLLDGKNRRPVHYAAACSGTGPLEFLLKRGQDPEEIDNEGMTCLMIACETGRAHNVEVLLKKANEDYEATKAMLENAPQDADAEDQPQAVNKYGIGGINRPNMKPQNRYFYSHCPLHIAILKDRPDCVDVLLRYKVDVHKELSASRNKQTPLMLAATLGQLDTCKRLIQLGGLVEKKDKIRKTPLMYAVIGGHAHVASYLLSVGADPNAADSSGNTAIHYAAAYGWYFCLKSLLEAGADPNKPNDWKVTPLGIAFMKGNMGLADYLLSDASVDINFKDAKGMTLVALACSSPLEDGIVEQVEYLINEKKADCTIKDVNGCSPLHHLAQNNVNISPHSYRPMPCPRAMERSVEIAKLLVSKGCDPSDRQVDGIPPVMYAVGMNPTMVKFLLEGGGSISCESDKENNNLLHLMAEQCMENNLAPLLDILAKSISKSDLKSMANQVNNKGFTPLLQACYKYMLWHGNKADTPDTGEDQAGGEDNEDEDMDVEEEEEEEPEEEQEPDVDEDPMDAGDEEDMDDDDPGSQSDNTDQNEDEEEEEEEEEEEKEEETPKSKTQTKTGLAAKLQWQHGRDFIQVLIKLCGANVNAITQKKHFKKSEKVPDDKKKHYTENVGLFTAPHFLVNVAKETAIVDDKGTVIDATPGLSVLLKFNPQLNVYDVYGRTPLLKAIDDGRVEAAKSLIQHGADLSYACKKKKDGKCTPVVLAAAKIQRELVELMVKKKAGLKSVDSRNKWTALHYVAAHSGSGTDSLKVVKALVKGGANVNALDHRQRTPLHLAVNANQGTSDASSEVESFLIESGSDVFANDNRGRLPLHYVFIKIGRHKEATTIDPLELTSTLTKAMNGKMLDVPDKWGQTPLHRAAIRGAGVCCTHLLRNKVSIDRKDDTGNTAVGLAVSHGHESCTIMLMLRKPNINVNIIYPSEDDKDADDEDEDDKDDSSDSDSDDEEQTKVQEKKKKKTFWKWQPLREKKQTERVVPLFEEVVKNNWQGVVFLTVDSAAESGIKYAEMVEAALNTNKFNLAMTLIRRVTSDKELKVLTKDNRNMFHILTLKATSGNQTDLQLRVAEMLHERGIPLGDKDVYGCTPLIYAAFNQNIDLLKFLLNNLKKINIEESDMYGRTALAAAFWKPQTDSTNLMDICKELMKYRAKIDILCRYHPDFNIPLYGYRGGVAEKDFFITHTARSTMVSPLIMAVCKQDLDLTKLLIERKASLNYPDSDKMTPIMHAVKTNDLHMVRLLLDTSYVKNEDQEESHLTRRSRVLKKKPALKKKHSRRLFTLGKSLAKKTDDSSDEEEDEEEYQFPLDDIDLDYEAFPKKSNVDLKARDSKGKSVLHHLVCSFDSGSYDNVQLLKMLVDAGASLKQADYSKMTPLDYALTKGAPKLAKGIQKLIGIKKDRWEKPTLSRLETGEIYKWSSSKPDYKKDSELLFQHYEQKWQQDEEEEDTPRAVPDDSIESDDTCDVVMDTEQDLPYDILLSKIDVRAGAWGLYNFYKMQVVYQKGKELFILFNRWGRIGDSGQFQQTPFPKKDDAIKEFSKIFKAKTGNDWKNVKNFENKPKKYRMVEAEERKTGKKLTDLKFELKSKQKSELPEPLQEMVKEMTDVTAMTKAILKMNVDEELMPLGRIKKDRILKAKNILADIKVLIESIETRRKQVPIEDIDGYHSDLDKIAHLSSEYFHLIPRNGYSYERIEPITDMNELKSQWDHINTLLDLELATKMLAAASYRVKEINPLDYIYRSMGCNIQLLNEDDTESQVLLKYIHSSSPNANIEGIFRISRPGEEKRLLNCKLENHRLLFHGSNTANLISILSQGLLVAPPEAPTTGWAFGKGIYTADTFVKSIPYCYNYSFASNIKFMLVCQVALGRENEVVTPSEELKPGFDSTKAFGRKQVDPVYDLTLSSGATVPLGPVQNMPYPESFNKRFSSRYFYMPYNEYIVHNQAQVCLRYIIQFS